MYHILLSLMLFSSLSAKPAMAAARCWDFWWKASNSPADSHPQSWNKVLERSYLELLKNEETGYYKKVVNLAGVIFGMEVETQPSMETIYARIVDAARQRSLGMDASEKRETFAEQVYRTLSAVKQQMIRSVNSRYSPIKRLFWLVFKSENFEMIRAEADHEVRAAQWAYLNTLNEAELTNLLASLNRTIVELPLDDSRSEERRAEFMFMKKVIIKATSSSLEDFLDFYRPIDASDEVGSRRRLLERSTSVLF